MRDDGWKRTDSPYNGTMRARDGITVFAVNTEGTTRAFIRDGVPLIGALCDIVADIDALEGDWRIDCISSPATIWRDLQGSRAHDVGRGVSSSEAQVAFPESSLLARIGRMDLWRA